MNATNSQRNGYGVVFLLGAVGGGLFVALATRAIPRIMSKMMSGMMQNMMSHMGESGSGPSEM